MIIKQVGNSFTMRQALKEEADAFRDIHQTTVFVVKRWSDVTDDGYLLRAIVTVEDLQPGDEIFHIARPE